MSTEIDNDLEKLREWLVGRVWPERYPSIEAAFATFGLVLQDFQETFREHAEPNGSNSTLRTRKYYQIQEWDPERYHRLSAMYEFHVDIVSDLMLELTRAGNLLCDEVRRHISHSYRIEQGRLMVQRGPDINLRFQEFAPQYSDRERKKSPAYPGLDEFFNRRAQRDWFIGKGKPT
jgi:plasmid stabilization system protein ParE